MDEKNIQEIYSNIKDVIELQKKNQMDIAKIIKESDYSLVNFEAPVKTNYSKPIIKSGSNLSQSAEVIDLLKQVGFRCFTLANNHFRDFGHDACENTLVLLQAKSIDKVGGVILL